MNKLNKLSAVVWEETHPEYNLAKDAGLYVLSSTPEKYVRYDLESSSYCTDEAEEWKVTDISEISSDNDSFGFWSSSITPLHDLALRVTQFEDLCSSVILELKSKTNTFGLTMSYLPKDRFDNFTVDFVKAWAGAEHKESLKIPTELERAELHLESLFYKWRKMVELYENVCNIEGLKEELYKML